MQNPIQEFRQSSIVFEKPGILSENLRTLTSSNYPAFQFFLLKLGTCFLLTNVYKSMCGSFYTFRNNPRSKENKKNPTHSFVDITK